MFSPALYGGVFGGWAYGELALDEVGGHRGHREEDDALRRAWLDVAERLRRRNKGERDELELLAIAACELLGLEVEAAEAAMWLSGLLPNDLDGMQRLLAAVCIIDELTN